MKVNFIKTIGGWGDVLDDCRTTVNKQDIHKEDISSKFKHKLLLSEHSPIRDISIKWVWEGLKTYVSTHFVRHHNGIDHFVSTQRTDRTGRDRSQLSQENPVNHKCTANQQALINISRKRLCHQASLETREAWQSVLDSIKEQHPELVKVCVKECVYRNGLCPEMNCCNYNQSSAFEDELRRYTDIAREQINTKTNIHKGDI